MAGVALLGLAVFGPTVSAADNPLSGWTRQGGTPATWQPQGNGTDVYVVAPNPDFDNANGAVSFFVSPFAIGNSVFRITMTADPKVEESDYIGFALGYQAPVNNEACTNATKCNTGFYLFDWKQQTEREGGDSLPASQGGQEGWSFMQVQGVRDLSNNNTLSHPDCFWTHQDVDNFCDVLKTDFGFNKGYQFDVSYTFEVTFKPNQIKIVLLGTGTNPTDQVFVDIAPPGGTQFPAGRIAFYNYSQPNVNYSFDDGTIQSTTTTSTTTPTTIVTQTTAAPAATTAAPRPSVGPVRRSTLVRTGLATTLEMVGGVTLLAIGALLTATRGRRPDGQFYA